MSSNEPLEQPLWELIYELLAPEEEAALLQRITSEPELARAYAKVKLQSELVAAAARCDDTRGTLEPPDDETWEANEASLMDRAAIEVAANEISAGSAGEISATSAEIGATSAEIGGSAAIAASTDEPVVVAPRERSNAFRIANWLVAVAAMGLVVLSAVSLSTLRSTAPRELAMADPSPAESTVSNAVRTVVTAPPVYNEETTNYISVRTASLEGVPAATQFELKLYDADGEVQLRESYRTDETGSAQVELSGKRAARAARLEIAASDNLSPPLATAARWVRSGHVTHLTTDLPLYEPGDTVSYRSLSLSRFDQRVDGEVDVEFDVLNELGTPVPKAKHVVTSQRGVGDGKFAIPADATDSKLTILARSPDGAFPEQRREVQIRKIEVPKWHKALTLSRDSYEPGDAVKGQLSVTLHDGQPAAGKRLAIAAFVDQEPLTLDAAEAITDANGNYDIQFSLPGLIARGEAVVTVNVEDDQVQEQLAKSIPIHTGKVDVQFYPEGGEFAAGLRNQVYFQAWDLQGQAVHMEGRIVDEEGRDVAQAATVHDGRGRFAITPRSGTAYRLIVDKPVAAQQELVLPAVSADAAVVLHTGGQVLGPKDSLDVTLRMRNPDRSLILAAACRGGLVALQAIEQSDFAAAADGTSACQRQLQLAPSASGVIRVTVYDADNVPPAPIAERLVYRRPATRLHIQVDPIEPPRPGSEVTLGLRTTDEQGQPAAATLGVSVVNQAVLNVANDGSPNLETLVFLTSEIRNADELEDANFFLGTSDEAEVAMDLLLGTQGWRRFEELGIDQIVQSKTDRYFASGAAATNFEYFQEVADPFGDPLVPVVLDNRQAIETTRAVPPPTAPTVSRQWIRSRESLLRSWGTVLLVGGLLVLIAVVGLASTRSLGRPRVWVPSVAMAGIAAVLGVFWMGSQVTPLGNVAYAPVSLGMKPAASASQDDTSIDAVAGKSMQPDSVSFARTDSFESELAEDLSREMKPSEKQNSQAEDPHSLDPTVGGKLSDIADTSADRGRRSRDGLAGGGMGGGAGLPAASASLQAPDSPSNAPAGKAPDSNKGLGDNPRANLREVAGTADKDQAASSRFPTPPPSRAAVRSSAAARSAPAAPAPAAPPSPALAARPLAARQLAETPAPAAMPVPAKGEPASGSTNQSIPQQTFAELDTKQENSPVTTSAASKRLSGRELELGQIKNQQAASRRYRRVYWNEAVRELDGREVPPTLLWRPLLITDAAGRASVTIKLPPTNATYVLRADAHGDGRIGSGQAMIDARQP